MKRIVFVCTCRMQRFLRKYHEPFSNLSILFQDSVSPNLQVSVLLKKLNFLHYFFFRDTFLGGIHGNVTSSKLFTKEILVEYLELWWISVRRKFYISIFKTECVYSAYMWKWKCDIVFVWKRMTKVEKFFTFLDTGFTNAFCKKTGPEKVCKLCGRKYLSALWIILFQRFLVPQIIMECFKQIYN